MKKVEITVYDFSELAPVFKQKAIIDFYNQHSFCGISEYLETIRAGLKFFCFDLDTYNVDPINATKAHISISDVFDTEHLWNQSGIELKKYLQKNFKLDKLQKKEYVYTGASSDIYFSEPIIKFLENPQNITMTTLMVLAYKNVLKALELNVEFQQTEEYFSEFADNNNMLFLTDGTRYKETQDG